MNYSLEDICNFVSGNAWKSELFSDNGIPIIRINNLSDNNNDFVYWPEQDYNIKDLVLRDDLLVSLSGTIKVYKWRGVEGLLNQRIVKITLKPQFYNFFNLDWIFYKIKNALIQIEKRGNKSTINNISVSRLKEIELLDVPILEEQNRIVTILDKVEAIILNKNEALLQIDNLINSIFYDTFGSKFLSPSSYEGLPLDEFIIDIQSGTSYNGSETNLPLDINEFGVLKTSAVSRGFFDSSQYKVFDKNKAVKKNIFPQKGDLLINRANTIDLVAMSCIVDNDYSNLVLPDKIWKIILDESKLKKSYLKFKKFDFFVLLNLLFKF